MDGQDRRMHLISFKDLFDIFSTSIEIEERMVLFYLILKENEPFRVFVLSRTDQETIVRKEERERKHRILNQLCLASIYLY